MEGEPKGLVNDAEQAHEMANASDRMRSAAADLRNPENPPTPFYNDGGKIADNLAEKMEESARIKYELLKSAHKLGEGDINEIIEALSKINKDRFGN